MVPRDFGIVLPHVGRESVCIQNPYLIFHFLLAQINTHESDSTEMLWNPIKRRSLKTVIRNCYKGAQLLVLQCDFDKRPRGFPPPPCFLPCWDNFSLSLITIAGQRRACTKRWCHWIASPLFLLCKQPLCNIQVWLYCPRCNYVCARVHVCVRGHSSRV